MATILSVRPQQNNADFQLVARSFLSEKGLPFAAVIPAAEIERIFRRNDALFGDTYNAIYTTAIVLWAFLSQVLADGKMRSCAAAVARIADFLILEDKTPPSTDTGDYCNARKKLCENVIHQLARETAAKMEHAAPEDWLWHGRHAKLADGFTATMADTPENQAAFPQPESQMPGVGFPIMRVCVIVSLATAGILAAAMGPYRGKETGEPALLRELLDAFEPGDVAVFDRYYSSYAMLALLMLREVAVCSRLHQARRDDFRQGKRLGPNDRLVIWQRPQRPTWMDEATYAALPETLTVRMIRFHVVAPGRRTRSITIVTTLLDPEEYSAEAIAELYGYRWNVELDIRHIKQNLNLDHLRCKTPEMVRKEFWATLLAYNLIRRIICAAAITHGKLPRHISFTRTCVIILTAWSSLAHGYYTSRTLAVLLEQIAALEIPDRSGRIEPRVLKRRRHRYPLMVESRQILKQRLESTTRCGKMS